MIDIRLIDGEIALGIGDFELVEGGACVTQDILERLKTDRGALFYAPNFGAGIPRFIHAPSDKITPVEFKAALINALQSEARVLQDSIAVSVSAKEGALDASVSFEAEDSDEPINLTLRVGREFEIYGSRT